MHFFTKLNICTLNSYVPKMATQLPKITYLLTYLLLLPLLPGSGRGGSRSSIWLHVFLSPAALANSDSGIPRRSSARAEMYFRQLRRGLPGGLFPKGPIWYTSLGRLPEGILFTVDARPTSTDSFRRGGAAIRL